METTVQTLRALFSACRPVRATFTLGLLLIIGFAQSGLAQSPTPPLNFGNNFFVTGDYIVAGAYNMTSSFETRNGVTYAVGTIKVPDANSKGVANPGIQGPTKVPTGAQVIAALLYWQAVEKVGAAGSGQNGYFRPVFTGGPAAPGYPIVGTNLTGSNTVSWSSGGCSGGSTGKMLRTYRADVAGGMPVDASGNTLANGTYEVRLPSVGNSTPVTLGATLLVIYRLPAGAGGPKAPLNAIVIYDGDYSQNNVQLSMTQPLQGFYDADQSTVTRLTHIVGSGQSNKFQTVYLYNGANPPNPLNGLPSLYGKQLPPFPGWYGTWDNPTWLFNGGSSPISQDSGLATTKVVPSMSNQGCVSWGAVIMSTTVKNTDDDGILNSWKTAHGYCDYLTNSSCQGSQDAGWIPLPGATTGQKDIFLQYDYMCTKVNGPPQDDGLNGTDNSSCTVGDGTNYSFDPRLAVDPLDNKNAVQKVVAAFENHTGSAKPFVLHAVPGNAIQESQSTCGATDVDASGNLTCPFPNEPGTVGFREGLAYIKNQTIKPSTGVLGCDPAIDPTCVAVFHHGKKDSYHYALFSHGVGLPNWFWSDGSISSVSQTGNTVTFTTSTPHNLAPIAGDTVCSAASGKIGRVTVIFAITNQNLSGTFCAKQASPSSPNKFAIVIPGSATTTTYTKISDPNLAVADGNVTSMSGYSDVGGQNSVISLGYGGWGPPQNYNPPSEGNKWNIKAGTFWHELGHTLGLTHGGTFYNNYNPQASPANNDYTPTFETNCKPNVQSIMSYVFQFDLLQAAGPANQPPVKVLDFSEDPQSVSLINSLTENSSQLPGYLSGMTYPYTSWFQLTSYSGASPASSHCNGTALPQIGPSYSYTNDLVSNFFWSAATGNDINFNGNANDPAMHPHNEWEGTPAQNGAGLSPGVDLQQVSVAGTVSTIGPGGEAGGLHPAGGGGGLHPAGGGGGLHPAGGGGGLHPAGGGGGYKPAGGGGLGAEITHGQANSYPRPPQNLFIQQEEASPRLIDLNWFAASFGTAVQYNVYRSDAGGTFNLIHSNAGSPPATSYKDTVACNTIGYRYKVTAVVNNDAGVPLESTPSNIVPAAGQPLLTGCYTAPVNVVAPASGVQGDTNIPVTWTLTDDFYIPLGSDWANAVPNNPVNNLTANTLYAIGPFSTDGCATVTPGHRFLLVSNGVVQTAGDVFNHVGNQFTFTWNNSDNFCAGSYTFELDLDSGQKFTSSALVLKIDVNDQDTPRITTIALPDGFVGKPYNYTLTEEGGTPPLTWGVTGLPSGISQQPAGSALLSGTACLAGSNNVSATVTDSASPSNSGSQAFSLQINKANTTTSVASNANPSVFQQLVTFTVTVAPQYSCTPTGTVTLLDGGSPIAANLPLSGGIAQFTTSALSVGIHSITATYSGDSNFNSSNSGVFSQTVNPAVTQIGFNSVLPSPEFVGQPITISYTFSVQAPGAGSPIPPSGNITVLASDGSSCMTAAVQGGGMCTLSPAPTAAGNITYTITYPGDGNFVMSGANGNYTVYQLVFTTQPSNTGVGNTITPAVVVTAEDSSSNTFTNFTGGITVTIGSGPGALSGTTTQNAVGGVATFSDLSINKIANGYTLTASPSGGVPDATSSAFNVDTFYVDGSGNFGTLDLASGTATQIASATVPNSTGMDLTPGLLVYEYNTSNQLIQITASSGAATTIGTGTLPNPTNTKTGALTTGSYFAIDNVTGNLYSIDLSSGATSSVGPTSTTLVPASCAFEASLAGSTNTLYYTIGSQGGTGCPAFNDTLYTIDPTTGNTTANVPVTVGGSPVNGFVGSAFVNGTLYGFTADGHEYSIDPATGVATLPKSTAPNIVGAGGS
jgi:hypothetical protein